MPWTSYAKTFSQIIGATQRLCGDIRPTGHYGLVWTWAEVADAVNRAILTAVDLAGGLRAGAVIVADLQREVDGWRTNMIRQFVEKIEAHAEALKSLIEDQVK